MAKTSKRTRPTTPKKNVGSQPKRRAPAPQPWYRRRGATTWLVIALITGIVLFALLSRGNQAPHGPSALPVVGADLHSLVADPNNASRLFIGSHQGVSVSSDGGETWQVIESLDGADAMGWAFTHDAILVGGHPGIYVSTDDGKTFEQRNEGLPNTDIHALGAGDGLVYAASPAAGVMVSSDGGRSWEVRNEEIGRGFMGQILVDPTDPDRVIAPDMQAGAVQTTDGGKTWDVLGGVQGAMWVSWSPEDTDDLVVTGSGSAVRSTDGGKTWDPMQIPPGASIVEFSPAKPDTLYAAVHENPNARVWVSNDGGETWDRP